MAGKGGRAGVGGDDIFKERKREVKIRPIPAVRNCYSYSRVLASSSLATSLLLLFSVRTFPANPITNLGELCACHNIPPKPLSDRGSEPSISSQFDAGRQNSAWGQFTCAHCSFNRTEWPHAPPPPLFAPAGGVHDLAGPEGPAEVPRPGPGWASGGRWRQLLLPGRRRRRRWGRERA